MKKMLMFLSCIILCLSFTGCSKKEALFSIIENEKYGFINSKGDIVISPQFEQVGEFSDNLAPVCFNDQWGFINKEGNYTVEPKFDYISKKFSNNLAIARTDGMDGYINYKGDFKIYPKFEYAFPFSEGLAKVVSDNHLGYVNEAGEYVIFPRYDSGILDVLKADFKNGHAIVSINGKFKVINKKGEYILKTEYELINWSNDNNIIAKNEKSLYGVISKTGDVKIPFLYDSLAQGEKDVYLFEENKKYGYLNAKGKVIIPAIYDFAFVFKEDLAFTCKKDSCQYIDLSGEIAISNQYINKGLKEKTPTFTDGIAFVFDEEHKKYGFINKKGEIIIKPQFSYLEPFVNGLAMVIKPQKATVAYGYINKSGSFVWKDEIKIKIKAKKKVKSKPKPQNKIKKINYIKPIKNNKGATSSNWSYNSLDDAKNELMN